MIQTLLPGVSSQSSWRPFKTSSTNLRLFTTTYPKVPKITSIPSAYHKAAEPLHVTHSSLLALPSEIILTIGQSTTVENFLKAAAHYRNFTVIVAETGPS